MPTALEEWNSLYRFVNGSGPRVGDVGVRDPDNACESFDGEHYDGLGDCSSDGHYLCVECSHLSPDAPRFIYSRKGRGDRLRLYWAHLRRHLAG